MHIIRLTKEKIGKITGFRISKLLFLLCMLVFSSISWPVLGQVAVLKGENVSNGYLIPEAGRFSFSRLPAGEWFAAVPFTVVNKGPGPIEFTGEKITLVNADDTPEPDFTINTEQLAGILYPGGATTFYIQFVSSATDGQMKAAQVQLHFRNRETPHTFTVACLAWTRVTVEFHDTGIYYWQPPGTGTANLTLLGGGGGGAGGNGSYSGSDGNGGGDGGSGQLITNPVTVLKNSVYTVLVGPGGPGGLFGGTDGDGHAGTGVTAGDSGGKGGDTVFYGNGVSCSAAGGAGGRPGTKDSDDNNYNRLGTGESGSSAQPNTGSGGEGGSGGEYESGWGINYGGFGGSGGSGYCYIVWTGFLE